MFTNYDYEYFSDERKLMELIQNGPVATWFDVNPNVHPWLGRGIYYNPDVCGNNEVVFIYSIF